MKTMRTILGIVLFTIIPFAFVSCGDDDDPGKEASTEKTSTSANTLQAVDGEVTQTDIINLSDLIGSDVANNLVSSEFQNSGWNIRLDGLKALAGESTIVLTSIKVSVNGSSPYDLGSWTTASSSSLNISDTNISSNTFQSFINAYYKALTTGDKKATLKTTIVADRSITKSDNVKLQFTITSKYVYRDYSTN